jgi:amino acid adenylation domain-containing protein
MGERPQFQEESSAVGLQDRIAVIGMAGRFPGARNVAELWSNLCQGVESIRSFTPEELREAGVPAEELNRPDYVTVGAPLSDADCFDAAFFGYTPREAELMDPQHRLFLECAYGALQDAGYDPAQYGGLIGVFGGVARNAYFLRHAATYKALVDEGALYEAILGSEKDFPAARVSYKLNLRGPSFGIQSACSTSGVAIHIACQSLLNGECDMALAGGARVRVPMYAGYRYVEGSIPSPDGHCRAFDKGANGCVAGSGVGMVVLKRLVDAIRDGDEIHAVLLATAINNDGSAKAGFTAPSVDGQSAVIEDALSMAGVPADTIDYVEAHGTGTNLGDPMEIAALTRAFRKSTARCGYCAIGSVKTNIGHLDAGAGVTGLIKTVLALKHGQIPRSLNFEAPNPEIDFLHSPFFVNDKLRVWPVNTHPRRAGVSSFGLGGTNFHAVLQQPPPVEPSGPSRPWQILTLSAKSRAVLATATGELAQHLKENPTLNLADAAYTLQLGRPSFDHRSFWVCRDVPGAVEALESKGGQSASVRRLEASGVPVVFMFPGQGAQHLGMGRELYEHEPLFAQHVDSCVQIVKTHLGVDLYQILYPKPAEEKDAANRLKQTVFAQPALFVIEYALAKLWQAWGVRPEVLIGHSVGEFVAAALAGVMSVKDALRLLTIRGQLMQQQPIGSMIAVRLSEEEARRFVGGRTCLAASNSPSLCVLSGPVGDIEMLEAEFGRQGIGTRLLETSHAFHSSMMDPVVGQLVAGFEGVKLSPPEIPFISSLTGTWITDSEATNPEYWAQQVRQPVRFSPGMQELQKDPRRVFLEVGPGKNLYTLAQQHKANGVQPQVVASLRHAHETLSDLECMLNGLGQLWQAGVDVDWSSFYENQRRRRVSLPTYPFDRKRFWLKQADRLDESSEKLGREVPPPRPKSPDTAVPLEARRDADALQPAPATIDRKTRIVAEIKAILSELSGVGVDEIGENTTFLQMGFDSLFMTQANGAFQKRFEVKITFRQLFADRQTPSALASYIDGLLPLDAFPAPALAIEELTSVPKEGGSPEFVSRGGAANPELIEDVIRKQLEIMQEQLEILGASHGRPETASAVNRLRAKQSEVLGSLEGAAPARCPESKSLPEAPEDTRTKAFGPFRPVQKNINDELSERQKEFLASFIERFNRKTLGSKRLAQANRKHLADPRTVAGFRLPWKECVYPIAAQRTAGAYVWDVDGNKYVDVAMGFGVSMLGHSPAFVTEAVQRQLNDGYGIGPQTPLAGEVAALISEMTGAERVAFCNTGSEAVLAATRIARTVTGRKRIVTFSGDYHGIFDEVLARNVMGRAVPVAPGVLPEMLQNILVLEYGDDKSLEAIEAQAGEIAAILVEPVRTREPNLQPRDFLHSLRKLATEKNIALVFDEMVTGFRIHPGGAQAWFGVEADIATYGKVVAGGLPIGIVAGKAKYMDALDGGMWSFGDESVPEVGVTWLAGTFLRHPLAMAASAAVLRYLKQSGPELQEQLNAKTDRFVREVNAYYARVGAPVKLQHFSSFFLPTFQGSEEFSSLFYFYLLDKGVHVTHSRAAFLSTAHSDEDIDFLIQAFTTAADELMDAGFLGRQAATGQSVTDNAPSESLLETHSRELLHSAASFPGAGSSDVGDAFPLTESQKEIWLAAQVSADAALAYNESQSFDFRGPFDVEVFRAAMGQVVERHPIVLASISPDGQWQQVKSGATLNIPLLDFSAQDKKEQELQLAATIEREPVEPFDLVAGPLLRVTIIRLSADHHAVLWTVHHIICDGWSAGILIRELAMIYSALKQGIKSDLPTPASFKEYSFETQPDRPVARDAMLFWGQQFAEVPPPLEMPTDRPRPMLRSAKASTVKHVFGSSVHPLLKRTAAQQHTTVVVMLMAVLKTLLYRLTGQRDLVVGLSVAGQAVTGKQSLVGHCVNLLPVRTRMQPHASVEENVTAVKMSVLDALDHNQTTIGSILQHVNIPRIPGRTPLVEVLFNLDRDLAGVEFHGLEFTRDRHSKRALYHDLFFDFVEAPDRLCAVCDYNTDLFDAATIERWLGHYQTILESIASNPAETLDKLPILTEAERGKQIFEWNDTGVEFPHVQTIPELFETQAERTPHRVALVFEKQQLTYGELNRRANQLAHHLKKQGVGEDVLVGVFVERSLEMVVALLGIMKAGGAYIPLDPDFPEERVAFMLSDAKPQVVLTQQRLRDRLPPTERVVLLDADWGTIAKERSDNPREGTSPNNLAYVIYTSGSTGKPKGVQIEHRSLTNLICSMQREPGLSQQDVLLAVTTLSFDIAGLEIYLPLISGARLVLADYWATRDGSLLLDLLRQSGATVMQATPSTWGLLIEAGWEGSPELKVLCGGEAMTPELGKQLTQRSSSVWNLYGPTETTIWSSVYRPSGREKGTIPIGRPISNTQFYVLDSDRNLVPEGVLGELYIGGDGLARGYLHRVELTQERFVTSPFDPDARLYRTGDVARRLSDGTVECLGRADNQVKIRGFRIELGEVEAVLGRQEAVRQCVVVAREEAAGDKRLVAYYEARAGSDPAASDLRMHLKATLPDYMAPTVFVRMDKLPLSPNGKIDRKALPAPAQGEGVSSPSDAYVAPRNETERALAEIFSRVLGVEQVGINDDFFSLGGHSLRAVHAISMIKSELNVELPVRVLFQAQTVSQIAAFIAERSGSRTKQSSDEWATCIPIQPKGSNAPLFCVARPNVNALGYLFLSRQLGPEQPVYGLQRRMPEDPVLEFTPEQIRETAEEYTRVMRSVQPRGPYFLVGQCQGAYIAFEMTRQLESQGERVGVLGMLDVWPEENTRSKALFFADFYARKLLRLFSRKAANETTAKTALPNSKLSEAGTSTPAAAGGSGKQLWRTYWPEPGFKPAVISSRIVVFPVASQPIYRIRDEAMGWSRRTSGGVVIEEIPGDHLTLLQEPFVKVLAEKINRQMLASLHR